MNSKMKSEQRGRALDFYQNVSSCAHQISLDLVLGESSRILYNLDYSVIHCGIWRNVGKDNYFDRLSLELFDESIAASELPFKIVITPFTFWEVIDAFYQKLSDTKKTKSELYNVHNEIRERVNQHRYEPISNLEIPVSKMAINQNLVHLESLLGGELGPALSRAKSFLGIDGPAIGLREATNQWHEVLQIAEKDIDTLYEQMWNLRSAMDKKRSDTQKEFRYLVDAINIIISRQAHEILESRFSYVTKARYIDDFCQKFGRNPTALLFWIKGMRFDDYNSNKELSEFFDNAGNEAHHIYSEILRRPEINIDKENYVVQKMDAFNRITFRKIISPNTVDERSPDFNSEELLDFTTASRFAEEQVAITEEGLRDLISSMRTFASDDLFEQSGLARTEYFKNLRENVIKLGNF